MIEAVFFDGDQTLWDFDAAMRRALAATVAELRRRRHVPRKAKLDVDALIARSEYGWPPSAARRRGWTYATTG